MGKQKKLNGTLVTRDLPAKGLSLGSHQFPSFDGLAAAFGADIRDYPARDIIPDDFYRGRTPYNAVVSALFFRGGSLESFGLKFKAEIDQGQAMTAIRALLCSFAPKHEIKEATVAWALSVWCDGTPKTA
ncbi:hypothetical protein IFT84_17630 [Rhizobium sp. CFBP 8762]|uniref:hypothetical protein n=1 Tax=Rhizobium sp. CFBP 8762 TaxID=2775279 RepID=UPI00177B478D|nr:hypothetical protein [Rhizobium sp. CFBP 8762]MBD8556332.1 hypothetical protein [Rhizobium sp. CFBP 8762]